MSADDARLLSIAVEALVAATIAGILNRRRRPAAWSGWRSPGLRIAAAALAALAGTLLSHPAAWPAMRALTHHLDWPAAALIVETGVVLVEGVAYGLLLRSGAIVALGLSAATNAVSFALGIALFLLR